MSTTIAVYEKTGVKETDLTVTEFSGGSKGKCLQLTQGIGGQDTPGYIQLTPTDCLSLVGHLASFWVDNKTEDLK